MKILVICFSNVSNVASSVPVIDSLDRIYSEHHFTMLSQTFFKPLFEYMQHVDFIGVNVHSDYTGVWGVFRLYQRLRHEKFDAVIDLQGGRFSRFLSMLFGISGSKRVVIDNQKAAMRRLILLGARRYRALKSIFDRYSDAFAKVNLVSDNSFESIPVHPLQRQHIEDVYGIKSGTWLGIAPFSEARGKTLPLSKMEEVIAYFYRQSDTKIFLFGLGRHTDEVRAAWDEKFENIVFVNDRLTTIEEELALTAQLDAMISMDSGNMHLAALTNTNVISVWGATHPFAGFLGWKQPYENCAGVSLPCRPCTAHSDKTCRYRDYHCLELIKPNTIILRTVEAIDKARREHSHHV
ncbi:MAG: glycosyltransferase family 9 protein [Prevotellaceae bacterium]|jgi:ADP-heptose:LPS heptosyltransferase|nr:glycosyltransferase family 9 protein [Prevotellaceae bacterium]